MRLRLITIYIMGLLLSIASFMGVAILMASQTNLSHIVVQSTTTETPYVWSSPTPVPPWTGTPLPLVNSAIQTPTLHEFIFEQMIHAHVVSPDGRWLAVLLSNADHQWEWGSLDHGLILYDLADPNPFETSRLLAYPSDEIVALGYKIAFSLDSKMVAIGMTALDFYDGSVRVYEADSGSLIRNLAIHTYFNSVHDLEFTENRLAIFGSYNQGSCGRTIRQIFSMWSIPDFELIVDDTEDDLHEIVHSSYGFRIADNTVLFQRGWNGGCTFAYPYYGAMLLQDGEIVTMLQPSGGVERSLDISLSSDAKAFAEVIAVNRLDSQYQRVELATESGNTVTIEGVNGQSMPFGVFQSLDGKAEHPVGVDFSADNRFLYITTEVHQGAGDWTVYTSKPDSLRLLVYDISQKEIVLRLPLSSLEPMWVQGDHLMTYAVGNIIIIEDWSSVLTSLA